MANHSNVSSTNSTASPPQSIKYFSGIRVGWSDEEQRVLEAGLVKYASEQNSLSLYTKIAKGLEEKTIRDVAMRVRWIRNKKENERRKKRKQDHNVSSGNNVPDNKEMVDIKVLYHSFVLEEDDGNRELIEAYNQNQELMNQIASNLDSSKFLENLPLFTQCIQNFEKALSNENVPEQIKLLPPIPQALSDEHVTAIISCLDLP